MVTQAGRFDREAYYADRNEGNGFAGEDSEQKLSGSVTSVSFRRPIPCNTIRGRLELGEMSSMRAERGLRESAQ